MPILVTQGSLLADGGQDLHQTFLGDDESVAVTEKESILTATVGGGKIDIRHDGPVVLYGKPASLVHAAEGAFIMGTAGGNL